MKAVRTLATLALLLCATRLDAQQYFGMNQVQYKHFKWQVIETEHFLVHYYPEERPALLKRREWRSAPTPGSPGSWTTSSAKRSRSFSSPRAPSSARTTSLAISEKAPAVSQRLRVTA